MPKKNHSAKFCIRYQIRKKASFEIQFESNFSATSGFAEEDKNENHSYLQI
jgi:hypothetical protein